jgi:O-methyltransferase domain/Dimerisation domain
MPTNPFEYIYPGAIAAQAIYAATRLSIPDLLAEGPRTAAELASSCGADAPALERLLRALTTLEMFERLPDGRYRNTPLTDVLRADHPQSQRDMGTFLVAPFFWRPLGELVESVRTGKPAFDRVFGQNFFDYLAGHPEEAALFNRVMTEGTAWSGPALLKAYNFSRFATLVDVGGGQGALLREILAATPELKSILFDQPSVVAGAGEILQGEITSRVEIVGGNFFESVPEGADAYILKGVIHDWPDDDAASILGNVRRAIRADGTLLLLDNVADSAERPAGMGDMLMLLVGGCDRTEAAYRALLAAAGFSAPRLIPAGPNTLIECHPV